MGMPNPLRMLFLLIEQICRWQVISSTNGMGDSLTGIIAAEAAF